MKTQSESAENTQYRNKINGKSHSAPTPSPALRIATPQNGEALNALSEVKERATTQRSLLQIRLSPRADERLDQLVTSTGIKNRTQLVNTLIDLAFDVITTTQRGASVVYEHPDGSKERLRLFGI